jgi:hypothetical protein
MSNVSGAGSDVSELLVFVNVNGGVADLVSGIGVKSPGINPVPTAAAAFTVIGDLLLQITAANSVVGFTAGFSEAQVSLRASRVIFTRLQ